MFSDVTEPTSASLSGGI